MIGKLARYPNILNTWWWKWANTCRGCYRRCWCSSSYLFLNIGYQSFYFQIGLSQVFSIAAFFKPRAHERFPFETATINDWRRDTFNEIRVAKPIWQGAPELKSRLHSQIDKDAPEMKLRLWRQIGQGAAEMTSMLRGWHKIVTSVCHHDKVKSWRIIFEPSATLYHWAS